MKFDIARQPLVPAFMTLFALAVAAMCAGIPVPDTETSGAVREALPLLGGQLARFQAAYPVWSKFAAGFMLLFTGMCAGRITIRYNLYTVGTCLPIPLYAIVACGIATGGNYLAGFAASMLLALATKNYCRAFCNGYGFDAIFRASLYLGLMPLIYAPALPLLLLLPLAVLLFRRTFREVVVATAGLLLPIFTACYVSWGSGAEFTAPLVTVGQSAIEGMPLQLFLDIPLPALVMAGGIVLLDLTALFFFLADIYAAGTKPRFILFYNIGILILTLQPRRNTRGIRPARCPVGHTDPGIFRPHPQGNGIARIPGFSGGSLRRNIFTILYLVIIMASLGLFALLCLFRLFIIL